MRYREYLRQRYRALLGYAGSLIGLIGILHLIPLLLLPFYPNESTHTEVFLLIGVPLMLAGYGAFRWLAPRQNINLTVPEAMVVVVMVWLCALIASALPYMAIANLTFTQAMFESTSGWSGTGLSVVNPEATTHILLLHRSLTQVWGGAGFAIIALSAIASPLGAGLSTAEGRTDQLAPHVRRSATIVLSIYAGYIAFGVLALRLAGMTWFDAINHAFTGVATGGFSTKVASIGHFNSALIEVIVIVLMLLGGINFFIAYTAIKGKWAAVFRSGEVRLMAVIVSGASLILFAVVTNGLYSADRAARTAVFEVVAALTSTGFATVTYTQWSDFGLALLALLMILGGGIGSTSGGIKLLRVYIIYKAVLWEVRKAFLPQHAVNEPAIWQGDKRDLLNDKLIRQVLVFVGIFFAVYIMGCGIMMAHGYSLRDTVFEVASAIGTAGLSTGVTLPTMPETVLWSQTVVMLLGRLEFFAVIIGIFKLLGDLGVMALPSRLTKRLR